MSNIRQDFIKARNILATHKGGIKERLIAAGRCGITVYDEENLPSHLKEDYKNLATKLTQGSKNGSGDGSIEQTVSGISDDDAVEIAKEFMDLATSILNTQEANF